MVQENIRGSSTSHAIVLTPGGTSILGGRGDLDLTSRLEAKFGARSGQVHPVRGKIWEVLLPQDVKIGKRILVALTGTSHTALQRY